SVSSSIGIAAAITHTGTFSQSIEAGIGLSASATLQRIYSKSVDAGLGIAGAISTSATFSRSVEAGLGIAGSITHVETLSRTVAAGIGLGITGISTASTEYERTVTSGIGIAGSVTHVEALNRTVSSGIGIAGSVTYSGYVRSVSSGIGIAGSVTHAVALSRTVGPSIGLCVAINYKVELDYNLSNRVPPVRGYIGKLWSTNASIQKELRIIDIGKYTKKEIQDLKDLGFKLNYDSPISITVRPTNTSYKIKLNMVTQNITAVGTTIESYLTYYKNGKAIRLSYYKDGYGEFNNVITHNNPIIVTYDTPLIIYCTHDVLYTSKIYLEGLIV
ncbi:MAG TPA: hypothetical protein PK507_03200, partial [bacterium]|nr:hypothetical protein [bacterium]